MGQSVLQRGRGDSLSRNYREITLVSWDGLLGVMKGIWCRAEISEASYIERYKSLGGVVARLSRSPRVKTLYEHWLYEHYTISETGF